MSCRAVKLCALAAAIAGTLSAPAGALADGPVYIVADATTPGLIDVGGIAPPESHVVFTERVGGRFVTLGEADLRQETGVALRSLARWRCDRLARTFTATATGPDGTVYPTASFSIRTPSCRRRLAVAAPRGVALGRRVNVAIRDRWRTGGERVKVCASGPRSPTRCRRLRLRGGGAKVRHSFRPKTRGRWRVGIRIGPVRLSYPVAVGVPARRRPAPRRTRVLATGDSTMQGVDAFLGERLGARANVVSRVRVGTGISKPGAMSWLKASRIQSSTLKPRATVVSVGANEGYPMTTPAGVEVRCCDEPWVAEYARRTRIMMRTWNRFGGWVFWMTLPAPGDPQLIAQFAAVNTAISRASTGLPRVRLARIDDVISPGGVFRRSMEYRGKLVRVRATDPVHLTNDGTAIAADAVVAAIHRSSALR